MRDKRPDPEALVARVEGFIREHELIPGPRLVVAVSGGPDSVCLLHILYRLREKLGTALHLAHLNHQLRGAESEADAEYVAQLAEKLDLPATIERRDVKAYQAEQRLSLEEAAREVRYTFLAQVAEEVGTERVAVGHTADDHIETILMHLIRGSGTRGLRGLLPSSRWRSPTGSSLTIARPLLPLSREETAYYCQQLGLEPRLDASNLSLSPLRNRIRQQLLPLLEGYNPRVREALLRTARIAADDLAFLEEEAARRWEEIAREQEGSIILDKAKFLELPPALKRHLLRTALEKLLGTLKDVETCHIEEMMEALDKPAGKKITLLGGLVFSIQYDEYLLGPDPAALSPFPILEGETVLTIPGKTELGEWQIIASIIGREEMKDKADAFTAHLDLDKVGMKLVVRPRRPGDRFQPLGMSQPKKLNEFMIDRKIPRPWRGRIPIVCSPQHIVWVAGWQIDERAKVSESTQKVLRLELARKGQ